MSYTEGGPSMGSEMEMDALIDEVSRPRVWVTKEKKVIQIATMGDGHLANAIAFVERNEERIRWNIFFSGYGRIPDDMGDAAQDAIDNEVRVLAECALEELMPSYGDLIEEWSRRAEKWHLRDEAFSLWRPTAPAFGRWIHLGTLGRNDAKMLLCGRAFPKSTRLNGRYPETEVCPKCLYIASRRGGLIG